MNEAQRQVLKMLQEGVITAEEANRLLAALGAPGAPDAPPMETPPPAGDALPTLATVDALPSAPDLEFGPAAADPAAPDLEHFRRFWQVPFVVALGLLVASGLCMTATYSGGLTLGFLCVWSVFMLAALGAAVALWSRTARWLHVRIREQSGTRFSLSLPLPLGLVEPGVAIARRFVDADTADSLDAAAEMVRAVKDELGKPGADPFLIEVNDEQDGDYVQIYIG